MEYISFTEVKKAYELNKHKIYVTGYFYDRGMEAKLAVESINGSGGISSVDGFKKAAVEGWSINFYTVVVIHSFFSSMIFF